MYFVTFAMPTGKRPFPKKFKYTYTQLDALAAAADFRCRARKAEQTTRTVIQRLQWGIFCKGEWKNQVRRYEWSRGLDNVSPGPDALARAEKARREAVFEMEIVQSYGR